MKKTPKKKVEEFIRVDHAGERGAIKIYEGQLLALNTIVKNNDLKGTIEQMKEHEVEHCEFLIWNNSIRQGGSNAMYRVSRGSNSRSLCQSN